MKLLVCLFFIVLNEIMIIYIIYEINVIILNLFGICKYMFNFLLGTLKFIFFRIKCEVVRGRFGLLRIFLILCLSRYLG